MNISHLTPYFTPYLSAKITPLSPKIFYQNYCVQQGFHLDEAQQEIIEILELLYQHMAHASLWDSLCDRLPFAIGAAGKDKNNGCYIHGNPGAGKSWMMDIFFHCLPTEKKINIHFHEFMLQIHHTLEILRCAKQPEPLKMIAAALAKICRVICFDEFHVTDVGDAMLLKNLFKEIFARHIILVATSNFAPDALYEGGIQRGQFLPFIDLLKQKCHILEITAKQDYRISGKAIPLWSENTPQGWRNFSKLYQQLTSQYQRQEQVSFPLDGGRELILPQLRGNVVRISFASLCGNPLSAADYLALSQKIDSFFIEDIPLLKQEDRNALKRFILLIDILYAHHKNLICLAAAPPNKIYQGESHRDEFERTISRLLEMEEKTWLSHKLQ